MLILILIGVFILSAVIFMIGRKYSPGFLEVVGGVGTWFAGIVIAVCGIVILNSYPSSLSEVAELSNFYDRNYKIWQVAIEKYPNAVVIDTKGETAKTTNLSRDFITQVLKYNKGLQWYQLYENHWFYEAFVTTVDKRLKFLEIPR